MEHSEKKASCINLPNQRIQFKKFLMYHKLKLLSAPAYYNVSGHFVTHTFSVFFQEPFSVHCVLLPVYASASREAVNKK